MGFISYFPELGEEKPTGDDASFEMKGKVLAYRLQPSTVAGIRTNFNPKTMEEWLSVCTSQFDKDDSDGTKIAECKSTYVDPVTSIKGLARTKQSGATLPKEIKYDASGKSTVIDGSTPSKAKNNEKLKTQAVTDAKKNKGWKKLGKSIIKR